MLSTANPSDLSCSSSKVTGSRADERDFDHLSLHEAADPAAVGFLEPQTPNFSIRHYVFSSRSKNFCSNWPFPRHLIELCLKHGIRDLLPPFEQPSSMRAKFPEKTVATTEKISLYQLHGKHYSNQAELSSSSDDVVSNSLVNAEGLCLINKEDKNDKFFHVDCEFGSTVTTHCGFERNSAQFREPGAVDDSKRIENIISASTTVLDAMASNVCPVCKTFSSTSNTTLNAHMDQCLAMESDTTLLVDKIQKLKVKLRKKRLMEDIYATAPCCTLEDLDRRNGSSWAKDITIAVPTSEANPKLPQVTARDNMNEGAVYVDSNGVKLRILSKIDDAPRVISMEELRPAKNAKVVKKKNVFAAKYLKKMKLKWKKKKRNSLNMFNNEIRATKEVSVREEFDHGDFRTPVQFSIEQEQISIRGFAELQRWPCSKRSDLPKKVCDLVKLSRSVESITVDFQANTGKIMENQKKSSLPSKCTSTNAVLLKLSSESAALGSSTRSTISNSSTKKLGKHRSLLGIGKRKAEIFSEEISVPEVITDPRLNPVSSHCQVTEVKTSEVEVENPILARDSLDKANNAATKSVNNAGQVLLEENDKTSSMEEVLLHKNEKQTLVELVCRGVESSAGLTSNGDPIPHKPRESSSIPSKPPISDRCINKENNHRFQIDSTEMKYKQLPDYHPCCCSMPTKKNFRNFCMKPAISSLGSYPSSQKESVITPVKESSPGSTLSSSNSILRLMGKNLTVIQREDSIQLSKTQSQTSPPLVHSQAPLMNTKGLKPKEITVIDGSEDDSIGSTVTLPRAPFPAFPYFPLHSPLLNTENAVDGGSLVPLPASLLPRPLVFQPHSAPNFCSLFYFPQTLR